MNSMKRTTTPSSRPNRAKSTTSSSFTPRVSTTLTFTGSSPAATAARMPASTSGSSSRRVVSGEAVGAQRVERHVHPPQAGGHQAGRQPFEPWSRWW
jgi:hypothetical protein